MIFNFTIEEVLRIIERMTRCKCISDNYYNNPSGFKEHLLFIYGLSHQDSCEYEFKIHPFIKDNKQSIKWYKWGDFENEIPPKNMPLLIYTIDSYGNGKITLGYIGNNGEWYACSTFNNIDFVNYWAHIPLSEEILEFENRIKKNFDDYMKIKKI